MGKLTIQIPVDDWAEEALRDEVPIVDNVTILEALERGEHTAKIARRYLVWRELGEAEEDTLPTNKVLLNAGATSAVSHIARSDKVKVETKSGTYEANALVGSTRRPSMEEDDDGESYIRYDDPEAVERAEKYLLRVVPGHIWSRMLLAHKTGGDVKDLAKQLKDLIDEMVDKLV